MNFQERFGAHRLKAEAKAMIEKIEAEALEAIDKHHGDGDVYGAITAFYGAFSSSQKPLEAEFSKMLFDNLWDLYAT